MADRLETLNCGVLEDCGFVMGDTELVRIGDLPAMTIGQFAEYSTETLLEILNSNTVPEELKERIAIEIGVTFGRVLQAKINHGNAKLRNSFDGEVEMSYRRARHNMAAALVNPGRMYDANPFTLQGTLVSIRTIYDISLPEFAQFSLQTLAGGQFGWGLGVPDKVSEHVIDLFNASTPRWAKE